MHWIITFIQYPMRSSKMADKRCREIFARLSEFLDGELSAADCRSLKRHLAGCKRCLEYLRTLHVTTQACRKYGERTAARPPRRLLLKLLPQLTAKRETKASKRT